jgi:twitching motility protein PilT
MELREMLERMVKEDASDLHLKAGIAPVYRINGRLEIDEGASLSPEDLKQIAVQLMTKQQQEIFSRRKELDFSVGIAGLSRFRVNIYMQRGSIAVAMRAIPNSVRSIDELLLPAVLKELALKPRGLILCTGTTGSGKSTTLASLVEHINENQKRHVITVEDPIEFTFRDKQSIISQRELGTDTDSFSSALRYVLRQDPDVILIGEIRDQETMDVALKAADTGHLVLSTLHTMNATETINRIISFYPTHQQEHIRVLLAATLAGVICLRLLPQSDGKGRVPAAEVLISTPTVKEYLLDPVKTLLIQSAIEEGVTQYNMMTFDQSIMKLYTDGVISLEDAIESVSNPDEFRLRLRGIQATSERGWSENQEAAGTS